MPQNKIISIPKCSPTKLMSYKKDSDAVLHIDSKTTATKIKKAGKK